LCIVPAESARRAGGIVQQKLALSCRGCTAVKLINDELHMGS